jgi:hypothetical protein
MFLLASEKLLTSFGNLIHTLYSRKLTSSRDALTKIDQEQRRKARKKVRCDGIVFRISKYFQRSKQKLCFSLSPGITYSSPIGAVTIERNIYDICLALPIVKEMAY